MRSIIATISMRCFKLSVSTVPMIAFLRTTLPVAQLYLL
jgi:hypothetical protein